MANLSSRRALQIARAAIGARMHFASGPAREELVEAQDLIARILANVGELPCDCESLPETIDFALGIMQ